MHVAGPVIRRGSSTVSGTNVVLPTLKSAAIKNCHSLHLTVGPWLEARAAKRRALCRCLPLPDGNAQALLMRGLPAPSRAVVPPVSHSGAARGLRARVTCDSAEVRDFVECMVMPLTACTLAVSRPGRSLWVESVVHREPVRSPILARRQAGRETVAHARRRFSSAGSVAACPLGHTAGPRHSRRVTVRPGSCADRCTGCRGRRAGRLRC